MVFSISIVPLIKWQRPTEFQCTLMMNLQPGKYMDRCMQLSFVFPDWFNTCPHGLEVTSTSSCSLSLTSVRRFLLTLPASSSLHCQLSESFCIIIKDSDFSSLCHSMDTSFSLGQDTTYDCNSNVPYSLLFPVHVLWIIPTPAWLRKSEHMAWRDRWSQLHYSSRYHYVQCSFQLVIQNSSPHEYSSP